jgi:hypothetical protein
MARRNKLLREAIADAKAVRETALANAKAALEEAFTPHLTSMLSTRLRNETDYGDEEDLDELNDAEVSDGHGPGEGGSKNAEKVEKSSFTGDQDVTTEALDDAPDSDVGLDSSAIATEPTQQYGTSSPKEPATAASAATTSGDTDNEGLQQPAGTPVREGIFEDDDEEDPFGADDEEEMAPEMGGGEMAPELGGGMGPELGGGEMEPELGGGEMEPEMGGGEMGPEMGGEDEFDDEGDRDLDLEAIIAELEADMMGDDEMDDYGEEEPIDAGMEFGDEEEEEPVLEQNDAEVSDGHGPGEGGEKDASVTADSSFTQGEGDKQTDAISEQFGDEDDDEIDLEEILKEIEDEENDDKVQYEVTSLRSELKEYRDAIRYLRSKLNEVNLLNAKLLFTNKLFKSYNMDVRQKMRVVEGFDRATTVREAKLVFATLAEAFRGKPVSRKRTITEGLASRAVGSTRSRRKVTPNTGEIVPTVLAEGAALAARFQKLAGIKS